MFRLVFRTGGWVRPRGAVLLGRCRAEAKTPALRVRLKAIAAQTSLVLFAARDPQGRCASGPFFRSAMTCSTIAWTR